MRLTIFRKEFRSRIGGLLALPVLAIGAGWTLHELVKTQNIANYDQSYASIMAPSFSGMVTTVCAIVGLAAGLWQMLPEMRVGQWAFLSHRPASIKRLFFGKLLAALAIYALVVGVPLIWVIWWAATPGHFFGPWLWQMALPPVEDFLCGTVFVLAGLLIGARDARWFGSRLLPVGLAVTCSMATWAPWWWVGLASIAAGWLLLLPAAYGAMAYRGRESRQGWVGRTLTGVSLIPAMVALPLMAGSLVVGLLAPQQVSYTEGAYHWYQLRGADLYETSTRAGQNVYRKVVGDQGMLLKGGDYEPIQPMGASASLVSDWKAAGYSTELRKMYRMPNSFLDSTTQSSDGRRLERWCYLRDQGYMVGYERQGEAAPVRLGYIGANGFSRDLASVVPFDTTQLRGSSFNLVVEPARVIGVNLPARQCATVFTAPQGEHATSAGAMRLGKPGEDGRTIWAATTDKATYVVDQQQNILLRQEHLPGYPVLSISASADLKTFGLLYSRDMQHYWNTNKLFVRVTGNGDVLARVDVPGTSQPACVPSTFDTVMTVMQVVCMPPVLSTVGVIIDQLNKRLQVPLAWLIAPIVGHAVVFAAVAFYLARRSGATRGWTVFWVVVSFLMGLSGVMLMLAVRHWPPRVRCTHCGRKTVITGFACQHCGKDFPVPQPGAIGVFDAMGDRGASLLV